MFSVIQSAPLHAAFPLIKSRAGGRFLFFFFDSLSLSPRSTCVELLVNAAPNHYIRGK